MTAKITQTAIKIKIVTAKNMPIPMESVFTVMKDYGIGLKDSYARVSPLGKRTKKPLQTRHQQVRQRTQRKSRPRPKPTRRKPTGTSSGRQLTNRAPYNQQQRKKREEERKMSAYRQTIKVVVPTNDFQAIKSNLKTFLVMRDKNDIQTGDILSFHESEQNERFYTGRSLCRTVGYVIKDHPELDGKTIVGFHN